MTIYSLDVFLSWFGTNPLLAVASWPAYRFLRRQVRWSGNSHLFKNFPQFVVIHTVKGLCCRSTKSKAVAHSPLKVFSVLILFKKLNWRIIALQCCVGFCHTATWISHNYTYVPFFLNLPLTPYPSHPSRAPGIHRAVDWTLCIIHQLSTSYL